MNCRRPAPWLAAALLLCSPLARAEDTERAKELFRKAETQFGIGEFRAALELYLEAYKAKPLAGFHFNIGQCYRQLSEHESAIFHFKQYLARATNATNRELAEQLIAESEQALQAQETKPAEQPTSAAPPPAAPRAAPAAAPAAAPSDAPGSEAGRILFWTGAGLSAGLLAVGTITGVLALEKSSRYRDPGTSIAERHDLRDAGQTLRTTSTVMFVIGGVAAAGTAVLYFAGQPFGGERQSSVSAAPLPGGGLVALSGQF